MFISEVFKYIITTVVYIVLVMYLELIASGNYYIVHVGILTLDATLKVAPLGSL